MVNHDLILTVISDDKPGVVEAISQTIAKHHGNWLKSRMCHLSGKFAGILSIQVQQNHYEALLTELSNLQQQGITVTVEESRHDPIESSYEEYQLQITGQDRPGIVNNVSQVLADRHINLLELSSEVSSAPMSAEHLFEASALIQVPARYDLDELSRELEAIDSDLMIEITPVDGFS